ncbi:hypothetical protein FRB93_006723 [Tulasnella sp. JGI-2019a]|nr:hypothetical protein FRB93_006723 [Tulasnella sp. JGI-2019a]
MLRSIDICPSLTKCLALYGNQVDVTLILAPIRIVAQSEAYPFLGLQKLNDMQWLLRACSAGWELNSRKPTLADTYDRTRPASSTIWTIKTLYDCTEELCAVWIDEKAQASLQAFVNSSSPGEIYIQTTPDSGEETVRLVLERF